MPAAFIYVFFREYYDRTARAVGVEKDLSDCIKRSCDELMSVNIPMPHRSTKHFLSPSERAFERMDELLRRDHEKLQTIVSDDETFAELIVDIVSSIKEEYLFEYWTYPESEYRRVDKAYEDYYAWLTSIIKFKPDN